MAKPVTKFTAGQILPAIWKNEIQTRNGGPATILKATVQDGAVYPELAETFNAA